MKFLTRGANEVPAKHVSSVVKDQPARKFVKPGNFDDAVSQFDRLKPKDVRPFKTPDGVGCPLDRRQLGKCRQLSRNVVFCRYQVRLTPAGLPIKTF